MGGGGGGGGGLQPPHNFVTVVINCAVSPLHMGGIFAMAATCYRCHVKMGTP